MISNLTTGAGGRFTDTPAAPFVEAVAFYPGNDSFDSASAFCPSS